MLVDHLSSDTTPTPCLHLISLCAVPQTEFFILDEADQMLDMGFKEEMEKVFKACGNDQNKATATASASSSASSDSSATVQTLLFSATMPDWVQKVAKVCNCHYCNCHNRTSDGNSVVVHIVVLSSITMCSITAL
jgi:superfamily II DNA/RNA helicase